MVESSPAATRLVDAIARQQAVDGTDLREFCEAVVVLLAAVREEGRPGSEVPELIRENFASDGRFADAGTGVCEMLWTYSGVDWANCLVELEYEFSGRIVDGVAETCEALRLDWAQQAATGAPAGAEPVADPALAELKDLLVQLGRSS